MSTKHYSKAKNVNESTWRDLRNKMRMSKVKEKTLITTPSPLLLTQPELKRKIPRNARDDFFFLFGPFSALSGANVRS